MPLGESFLVGLTTAARKAVIRGVIPDLFRQGYSATAALNYLRGFGPVMRRQDFLAQWREITGAEKLSESFRFIPKKYRIPGNLYAPTAEPMTREYKYLFRVQGTDLTTGEPTHRWFSFLDDARMSPDEAESTMRDWLQRDAELYEWLYDFDMDTESTELFVLYRSR